MIEEYPIKMSGMHIWYHLHHAYDMYVRFGCQESVGQIRVLYHIITGEDFNYHYSTCKECKRKWTKIPKYIEDKIEKLLDGKRYGFGNLTIKRKREGDESGEENGP